MTDSRRTLVAVRIALAAAFAILAVLVVAGACTRLDEYAIDHWVAHLGTNSNNAWWRVVQPYPDGGSPSETAFNIWTFPASVFASAVGFAVCCTVLVRRGHDRAAATWIVIWLAANAIEVAGKGLLHRPTLTALEHGVRLPVRGFDSSFPSGHTARGLLLAAVVVAVWPRLAWPAGIWALGTCIFLVVSGGHTPSDVLGGALVALFLLTWAPWRPPFLRQEWRSSA